MTIRTGIHALLDAYKCEPNKLNDEEYLMLTLQTAASLIGTMVLKSESHRFDPHGVSVTVIIKESHLSIHTFPELRFASVDCYSCGKDHPRKAIKYILKRLGCKIYSIKYLRRGKKKRLLNDRPTFIERIVLALTGGKRPFVG